MSFSLSRSKNLSLNLLELLAETSFGYSYLEGLVLIYLHQHLPSAELLQCSRVEVSSEDSDALSCFLLFIYSIQAT